MCVVLQVVVFFGGLVMRLCTFVVVWLVFLCVVACFVLCITVVCCCVCVFLCVAGSALSLVDLCCAWLRHRVSVCALVQCCGCVWCAVVCCCVCVG